MHVKISYGASWSYLEAPEGAYPGLIPCVRGGLAIYLDTAVFAPSFAEGRWDGYVQFMSEGGRFASGLLDRVCEICRHVGFEPVVEGLPGAHKIPVKPPNLLTLPPLRQDSPWWFQWAATEALHQKFRGVLRAPTASGKTNIAALLIKSLPDERVLFLVDQIELLDQTAERFKQLLGEPVGVIGGGSHTIPETCRICVATVQTLAEKRDKTKKTIVSPLWTSNQSLPVSWLSDVSLLIMDECHCATSDGFFAVAQAFKKAHRRIGLSATPFNRGDLNTMKLIACCGEETYSIPIRSLIEAGVLAKPNIYMINYSPITDVEFNRNSYKEYEEVYETFVYNNAQRNKALISALKSRTEVLVIVNRKSKHGEVLKNLLSASYPDKTVAYVSGDSTRTSRQKKRADFLKGKIDILIATGIYDKGVDLPNVTTLVLAGGGKSEVNTIQRLGRGMRGALKDHVDVFDFFDQQCEYLLDHTLARYDTYTAEGYDVKIIESAQLDSLVA